MKNKDYLKIKDEVLLLIKEHKKAVKGISKIAAMPRQYPERERYNEGYNDCLDEVYKILGDCLLKE